MEATINTVKCIPSHMEEHMHTYVLVCEYTYVYTCIFKHAHRFMWTWLCEGNGMCVTVCVW